MSQILDINYNEYVNLVGTAHFTRRSIRDACQAIHSLNPEDVALELDWRRFQLLNVACLTCPKKERCEGLCEFTGAAEALGNVDANIWLIDMTEQEMRRRIRSRMTPVEKARMRFRMRKADKNSIWLWEQGFKERVINHYKRKMETLQKQFPSIYRVLIDERNAVMAARLAWIVSDKLDGGKKPEVLAFLGAAHIEGIKDLLMKPYAIQRQLSKLNLSFTQPTLIRRVAVQ